MTTTPLQKKNRTRIVEFLRTRVPRKRFDFSTVISGEPEEAVPNLENPECGTVACAIGWTPICFPKQMKFDDRNGVLHIKKGHWDFALIGKELFGVSYNAANYLFCPDCVGTFVPGHRCTKAATPKQVAERLQAYFKANP